MIGGGKYLRSNVCCTICAVSVDCGRNQWSLVIELFPFEKNGNATHRNGLIKVGGSRKAIMVEEFGRGAQCAHAGVLSGWGQRTHIAGSLAKSDF